LSPEPQFWELHGLDGPEFDAETVWQAKGPTGALQIPIGVEPKGSTVALDFSRWTSLDDHVLVVGAPNAGTSTLLRTVVLGLCISRSPADANFLVAEGKAGLAEFAELAELPHCTGHVTFNSGEEDEFTRRLAEVVVGAVQRREHLLRAAGVASIEDYRQASKTADDLEDLPETFMVIDDLTWLHTEHFDEAARLLITSGFRLGLRLIAGVPYPLRETLSPAGYFDRFTARIALGLSQRQASSVLGADVPQGLTSRGDAYFNYLGGELARVKVISTDRPFVR
jgi:DNA segregation ATPase FtsK/SpoIIIE-like protein